MRDSESATEILRELVGVGLAVSIDDFGTGYSSLNYLKRFPVQKLKIDRSFVSGIGNSDVDAAIAHAVTRLGHGLGRSVLAEGVETKAQGFLVSRPISTDDFARSMRDIWAESVVQVDRVLTVTDA